MLLLLLVCVQCEWIVVSNWTFFKWSSVYQELDFDREYHQNNMWKVTPLGVNWVTFWHRGSLGICVSQLIKSKLHLSIKILQKRGFFLTFFFKILFYTDCIQFGNFLEKMLWKKMGGKMKSQSYPSKTFADQVIEDQFISISIFGWFAIAFPVVFTLLGLNTLATHSP